MEHCGNALCSSSIFLEASSGISDLDRAKPGFFFVSNDIGSGEPYCQTLNFYPVTLFSDLAKRSEDEAQYCPVDHLVNVFGRIHIGAANSSYSSSKQDLLFSFPLSISTSTLAHHEH
jgi:hypothetical protein